MIELINASGRRSSPSTSRPASTHPPARSTARRCARRRPSPSRGEGRARGRPRAASTPAACRRADSACAARDEHALVPAIGILESCPARRPTSTKYTRRVGARRRRLPRPDRGADAGRARRVSRRRRLRRGRRAPESTLPVLETTLLEVVKRPLPEDSGGRLLPRRPTRRRGAEKADAVALGPGLGRTDGTVELVRILLERLELPSCSTPTPSGSSSPSRDAHRPCSPRTRGARAAARRRGPRGRCAPARRRLVARPPASARRAAEGRRHARRLAPGGCARRDATARRRSRPQAAATSSPGIVAAFLAKGLEPRLAAATAAVAHGVAAELRAAPAGLVACDLLPALPLALASAAADRSGRSRSTSARCAGTWTRSGGRSGARSSGRS